MELSGCPVSNLALASISTQLVSSGTSPAMADIFATVTTFGQVTGFWCGPMATSVRSYPQTTFLRLRAI